MYDRYKKFRKNDGTMYFVPFIEIPVHSSDLYATYEQGKTRLDKLSYDEYGDCDYDWLILQSNPQYGSYEFEIPDGAILRIPQPINSVIREYEDNIDNYIKLYGLE